MKTTTIRLMFLVLALGLASLALRAANQNPPGQITYQGFLTDANGIPLATNKPVNYNVTFQIYNAPTGTGTNIVLWGESQVVTVNQGYFSVLLGQGVPLITPGAPPWSNDLTILFTGPTASDRYIGITVSGLTSPDSEIAPRLRLLAAPYSLLAANALNVTGNNAANVGSMNASGTMTASNFVGFGTIPIGGIIMWSGSNVPTGWALCDGTQGTPDLRGRFVLGSGSGVGLTTRTINDRGGAETHTNTISEMAPHNHDVNDPGHSHTFAAHSSDGTGFNLGAIQTSDRGVNNAAVTGEINPAFTGISIGSKGSGQPYNTMSPFYVLAYIMRVQ